MSQSDKREVFNIYITFASPVDFAATVILVLVAICTLRLQTGGGTAANNYW